MPVARRDLLVLLGSLPFASAFAEPQPEKTLDADLPLAQPLTTLFSFIVTVPAVVGGEAVDVWIPVPSDDAFQTIRRLSVSAIVPYQVTRESRYGNRMVHLRARPTQTPLIVIVSFVATRKPVRLLSADPPRYRADSPITAERALGRDAHVPTGEKWRVMAQAIVDAAAKTESAESAEAVGAPSLSPMRALYDHVVKKIEYDDFALTSESGKGDAGYVAAVKKGDSLDLCSYLVALARSLGIPCYVEFGIPVSDLPPAESAPTQGAVAACRAYVWFRDGARGWLPLDVSDGRRWADAEQPAFTEYLFGNLLTERAAVAVSHGRDLTLDPPQRADPLSTFAAPYAEADGLPVTVGWRIHYSRPKTPNKNPVTAAEKKP